MPKRHIVQCARTVGPGYGVSGPTFHLERAFQALGCGCERFSLADLGIFTQAMPEGTPLLALLRFWRDVLVFSTLGSLILWWRYRKRPPGTVVICQVDALFGDLFVVRALHKGFLANHPQRWLMLLRNPLHAFVLARDHIRFKGKVHKHFVALSKANKEQIIQLYQVDPERITVIPNGVDLRRFRACPVARGEVRGALSIPAADLVAIFVGHEFERKGLRIVLEALRMLASQGTRLWLLIAGRDSPDPLRADFADLAPTVRFLGNLPDLERYYAASDLFVMPAAYDISPLVGPEALACGLPLLMTDVGGVRDYLEDGSNGLLIGPDPGDLAEKLTRLAHDPVLLASLSARARPSVADRDWPVVAGRFLELLDRLDL